MDKSKVYGFSFLAVAILLFFTGISINSYFESQNLFMCTLVEQNPDVSMDECPAHSNSHLLYVATVLAIAFLSLLTSLFFLFYDFEKKEVKTKNEKNRKQPILSEEESKVIELLNREDGSVYQSDVVKHTNYSKVKTTRILDKLEGKNLIERKRRGMTNIVILKK